MEKHMFRDREFLRRLTKLTLPIALQSLMLAAVAAADALMLGTVEQNYMSAVSLATQIQFVQNMFLGSVAGGIGILGAQYWGKGDKNTLENLFSIGIRINGIISLIFFIGCEFFPELLMRVFTNESSLIGIGAGYLRLAGWSYLITGISQVYLAVMRVSDHVSIVAKISSSCVIVNIILNAVFIYGFDMNVRGAALATLIARAAELIWAAGLSFRPGYIQIELKRLLRFEKLLEKDFWKCILPVLSASLLWGVGFTSYSAFMGHLGEDAVAANSVAAVVRDLVCCMCNGIAAGGGILVGNEMGAGKLDTAKVYGDRIMKLAFVCGAVSTIVMLALTPGLMAFVKLTDEAKQLFLGMMLIMAFYMIGRAVNTIVINGIFYAGGDTIFDTYSLVVTMWGMAIPLAALGTFVFGWHPLIVYACTCLDEVGKIPWVMHHYKKYKWLKNLTR